MANIATAPSDILAAQIPRGADFIKMIIQTSTSDAWPLTSDPEESYGPKTRYDNNKKKVNNLTVTLAFKGNLETSSAALSSLREKKNTQKTTLDDVVMVSSGGHLSPVLQTGDDFWNATLRRHMKNMESSIFRCGGFECGSEHIGHSSPQVANLSWSFFFL